MKRFLIGTLKLIGLSIIFAFIAGISPQVAKIVGIAALVAGGIAVIKPLPKIGLGNRAFAFFVALLIGGLGLTASNTLEKTKIEEAAQVARLAELKVSDVDTYLIVLRDIDEDRWLNELEELRPNAFQAEMDRRAKQAAERAVVEAARAEEERLAKAAEEERRAQAEEAARVAEAARAEEERLAEAAKAEEERLARAAEEERRAQAEQVELDAKVAEILALIREGKWVVARTMLGRLGDGDLTAAHAEIEAAALSIVESLPADLEGTDDRYAFLSRLRPDNPEYREKVEQAELNAKVADILESIREGNWSTARLALGRLGEGDLNASYDQFEAAALAVVRPLPASDLNGNLKGYELLSKLRPDNAEYRSKVKRYAARVEEARRSRDRSRAAAERQRLASVPNADDLAKVSGALMGMVAACGGDVSYQLARRLTHFGDSQTG